MVEPIATARLKIDLSAIVKNWEALNSLSGCAGAAVKANAYGLGAARVCKALYEAGCRDFFVANWDEAHQLKDVIPQNMISVLNGIDDDNIEFAKAHEFKPVLNTPYQIILWRENEGGLCDVMLDSGINRLGIGQDQLDNSLFEYLDIDIAMSHLASADEVNPYNEVQRKTYDVMCANIKSKRNSLANSAGIMLGADYHYDLSRPGIALYGGIVRDELKSHISSVISIKARVLQTRMMGKGQGIGYNSTYICPEDILVATASLGYADGYLRNFSSSGLISKGFVRFENEELPIIGRISMDLITIDMRNSPSLNEGDWIEVAYDLQQASVASGLSQYELLTILGHRFHREYK